MPVKMKQQSKEKTKDSTVLSLLLKKLLFLNGLLIL